MDRTMRSFCRLCVAVALFADFATARADVMYQCVDEQGHRTFSNVKLPDKGIRCTPMDLGPMTSVPPAAVPRAAARPASPSPAGFPRVGENAQKERDDDRRRILESELDAERQNLELARKDLSAQGSIRSGDERNYQKVLDRLEPYKNKVALHERNIEAIEKELAKLR
ncbi:MAG: DUF4124 domain-containing protein [Candidatus Accumulibacter sp.]|jgi:hypothetical protein|nr:DUF4124 domain-containing protein [Accumulibacter sp.]